MAETYGEFAELYDRLMDDVDYGMWTAYLLELLGRMDINPEKGPLVLECACGTGSITVGLKKAGCAVIGSDLSGEMLFVAQRKARAMGLQIPFVQQDMRALSAHKKADAVVCCCDGVNYLCSQEALNDFFHGAMEALRPGGALLFDVSTAYKLGAVLGDNTFGEDRDGCTYLWQNHYDEQTGLVQMDLTFFLREKDGRYRRFDETHLQRAHGEAEVRSALASNGFCEIMAYDAFTGNPPKGDSERIQWTARKAAAKTE